MSAVLKSKQDALTARLTHGLPGGGGWLGGARSAALARLQAMGLPAKRDEYWRYTDPASLNLAEPPLANLFTGADTPVFGEIDRVKLVFVDGVFDAAASDDPVLAGVEIMQLSDAARVDIHWARGVYGLLEADGQDPVHRPLAALNTALAEQGVLIRVTGKAEKPVSFIYLRSSQSGDAMLHHVVRLEPGAELTLLENGPGAARFNSVIEVDIAEGAALHHIRTQGRDHQRRMNTHMFVRLAARARFKSFTLSANGRLTRNESKITLLGAEASAHIAGAAVGDGDFHHDDTVFLTHGAERCESRQVFKKVLKNGATGVFQGKILVKQGAQKTDGYQISQSLLLDDDSQFLAKPELEIYADDVKCSHGSTSGAIDETALYYLRSRGVPLKDAQALLVLAFLAEAIQEIEDETIAEEIRDRLEAWLHRHKA
jgi:Fe-S cluster assembly protein SufD